LLALESNRLPALTSVRSDGLSLATTLVSVLVLGACAAWLCYRPKSRAASRPAPLVWPALAAIACSAGLVGVLYLGDWPVLWMIGNLLYAIAPVLLTFFWVQRAMPLGRTFVLRAFGVGAVVLGCLSMLTMTLDTGIALDLVVALPVVGVGLLPMVGGGETPDEADAKVDAEVKPVASLADQTATGQATATQARRLRDRRVLRAEERPLLRLVPFLCYAVIFGNVHFSWVALQDGGAVSTWVQLGASTGSILCGLAALGLARLHWGRAFESIAHLLLASFTLVALWLSTFLTSGYVFVYLVLLNIAQKLTFMLMLLFGFFFATDARWRSAAWALAYFSFFAGTCVSGTVGTTQPVDVLNVIAALALLVVFAADIADVVLLYGDRPKAGAPLTTTRVTAVVVPLAATPSKAAASGANIPVEAATEPGSTRTAEPSPAVAGASAGFDALAYTCHLIASRHDLTRREEEILQLLVRGRTAARIAETLCITVATTRTHLRNIYAKLGVHSQQDILDLYESFSDEPRA
jgi:DNA-binding CsgD family transcriptional regulator